jgi:hypothetical protein
MLDRETIDLLMKQLAEQRKDRGDDPLAALKTPLEVIGWVIEKARDSGFDECDAVELVLSDTDRETLREYAATLKLLGYHDVAARLRQMARQRTRKPRRDVHWPFKLAPRHRNAMN